MYVCMYVAIYDLCMHCATEVSIQVMDRAEWDEEQETWMLRKRLQKVDRRPISTAQHRRPMTAYAQAAVALGDHNPRYKTDNILALALDMPDRTTADYSGSQIHTQVWRHWNFCLMLFMPVHAFMHQEIVKQM